ncbi:MAG: metal-sensing transcriptional repressor [Oscillospiraceae bacterium]|nr:metal-sensing transcriptional repressor [Oscillospiraceae bacterium]
MHEHQCKKAVLNRMARAIGHMNAIKKMIEEDRDCSEILIQLSAVKAEIANAGKVLLKEHLEHCVVEAALQNDEKTMKKLMQAVDKML